MPSLVQITLGEEMVRQQMVPSSLENFTYYSRLIRKS